MRILVIVFLFWAAWANAQRPLVPSDVYRFKTVADPQLSPDGKWVAYVLATPDSGKDKSDADIWMVGYDGKANLRLTSSEENEVYPRWSPDGKYLSFLSSRYNAKVSQVWRMDLRGGEAEQVTASKVNISQFYYSPDATKLLLVIKDQEPKEEEGKKKTPKPIMMDRHHFKQDGEGFLERKRTHLYLFDLASRKMDTLTRGDYDHSFPAWSPDGKHIAFVSNRSADPDRNGNTDIWIMEARKGGAVRQLTTWPDADTHPVWSPDGKSIAYLKSQTPEFDIYDQPQWAVVPVAGGTPVMVAPKLDREIGHLAWAADGKSMSGIVEDDCRANVYRFGLPDNSAMAMTDGDMVFSAYQEGKGGQRIALMSHPMAPPEIYALEGKETRRLTHIHEPFLKGIQLGPVEKFSSTSKDGTRVSGLLFKPPGKGKEKKLPLVLWIHGGPTSQDDFAFDFIPQVLAGRGYAVATVNYRGSSGRGMEFSKAIYGDWGNKEVMDLLGAVDYLIKTGEVDAARLGIGGWSYGGILTDYTTATDPRFKAAASGAGSALQLSMYGSDQYTLQYETELGVPWKNMDKWMKVSYPFLKVDRIKTPTLYMVGEKDFNVPAAGSEQMYQALKTLGVPTQFVVYPGQNHGITVPSYQKDRLQRYVDWFGRYLEGLSGTSISKPK